MKLFRMTGLTLILIFILVACDSGDDSASENNDTSEQIIATDIPTDVPVEMQSTETAEIQSTATEVVVQENPTLTIESGPEDTSDVDTQAQTVAYQGGAWTQLELTNVGTGETFTLSDFAGRTVLVHPMATWCTRCLANQQTLRASVVPELDPERFVVVSLSIEPFEDQGNLAQYAINNNFDWVFAVVTNEMLGELISNFGSTVSNPPTQPHFIIHPDGTSDGLMTGGIDVFELLPQLETISQAG